MNLFGQAPKKRGQHGPARTGEDRLKRVMARIMEDARKNDPAYARRLAEAQLGLRLERDEDPWTRTITQIREFREVFPDVRDVDKPEGVDWAKAIAGALALFAQMQGGGVAPAALPSGAPPAPGATEVVIPADAGSAPASVAERRRFDPLPHPTTLVSRIAYAMVQGTTPREAAETIAQRPEVPADMLDYLARTPDDEVIEYLTRIAAKQADLGPLIRWVAADPEWAVEVVRELRRVRGVEAPGAAA